MRGAPNVSEKECGPATGNTNPPPTTFDPARTAASWICLASSCESAPSSTVAATVNAERLASRSVTNRSSSLPTASRAASYSAMRALSASTTDCSISNRRDRSLKSGDLRIWFSGCPGGPTVPPPRPLLELQTGLLQPGDGLRLVRLELGDARLQRSDVIAERRRRQHRLRPRIFRRLQPLLHLGQGEPGDLGQDRRERVGRHLALG